MKRKKVLVSGCYDLLHGGHIAFFKTAATFGDLYVSIGRDENLLLLKGKRPVFSEEERLFTVKSIRYVYDAFLASGRGMLDFEPDLIRLKPDIFVVNSDGHTPDKGTGFSIWYWKGYLNPAYLTVQVQQQREI
jgi:cytidyltransferase-like protein